MPQIIILTGPPGAGKSTIGEILAKKIKNSAIVSTDTLRHLIKNGKANKGDEDWNKQLRFGAKNAVLLAKSFYENGFNVFLDDVICIKERLDYYCNSFKGFNFKILVLMPQKNILAKRDLGRGEWAMGERALYLHDKSKEFIKTEKRLIVINNSKQTPEQTANKILKKYILKA